jgi:predicted nucleotidyltransferase
MTLGLTFKDYLPKFSYMKSYQDWQKRHPAKAGLLAACAAAIRRVASEAEVILYGSVARGEETPESDVDLLVLVPEEVTHPLERAIRDQVYEIELENDQIISVIARQNTRWHSKPLNFTPLYRAIEKEGRMLFTLDVEFGDLRKYPPGSHPGIILFRPKTFGPLAVNRFVEKFVHNNPLEPLAGCVVVVEPTSIRVRHP